MKQEQWRKRVQGAHGRVRIGEYGIDVILCPAGVSHNEGRAAECKRVVIHQETVIPMRNGLRE